MKKNISILIISLVIINCLDAQYTCEDNCGNGILQDYWNGSISCVCTIDCAGYGDACCDFYDECYDNPSSLDISDFLGIWDGNITNSQTWSYDYPITIHINSDGSYSVPYNPGNKLVSDLYPGTEEVYYNSNTNILSFQWVQYYHYSCGGACYSGVSFQVMDLYDGNLTLFYNNGSGPAPQANSMFLELDGWNTNILGDLNQDGICNITDIVLIVNIVIYDGSIINDLADINQDEIINILDIINLVQMILNP